MGNQSLLGVFVRSENYSSYRSLPFTWLKSVKELRGRLLPWMVAISEYERNIEYKTGKDHSNADGLSRRPRQIDDSCINSSVDKDDAYTFVEQSTLITSATH